MDPRSRTRFRVGDEGVDPYRLMTAIVVPRPIAWVSTLSADGVVNLAPHSFYTVACARPPIVQFTSVGSKDTLRNVRATREFVVNLAHGPLIDQVNATAARFAPDQSEPEALDIAMEDSDLVAPPRVSGSPAALECRLHSTLELGDSTLVLGHLVAVSVADDVLDGSHPVYDRLDPLTRLGRDEWGVGTQVVRRTRPSLPSDVR